MKKIITQMKKNIDMLRNVTTKNINEMHIYKHFSDIE